MAKVLYIFVKEEIYQHGLINITITPKIHALELFLPTLKTTKREKMKTGIELIVQERNEQLEKHGRTIEADLKFNGHGQLSEAASILTATDLHPSEAKAYCPSGWDIDGFEYMMSKPYKQRLIIAGALIAAEIDRLQRIEEHENKIKELKAKL